MLSSLRLCQPTSVSEASAALSRLGDEAKVYAGGTELIPLLRLGLVHYTHLVDIKRIPALGELAWDGQTMHIGSAVTHRQLERSAAMAEHLPLLQQATALVANVRVPKLTLVVGNSYGAGNYAMASRALKPDFVFAWPSARTAVMGGAQAGKVMRIVAQAKLTAGLRGTLAIACTQFGFRALFQTPNSGNDDAHRAAQPISLAAARPCSPPPTSTAPCATRSCAR